MAGREERKKPPLKTRPGRTVTLTEKAMAEACRKVESAFWKALFKLENCSVDLVNLIKDCKDPTIFKNCLVSWMSLYNDTKEAESTMRQFLSEKRLSLISPDMTKAHDRLKDVKEKAFKHLGTLTLDMQNELDSGSQSSHRSTRSHTSKTTSPRKLGRSRVKVSTPDPHASKSSGIQVTNSPPNLTRITQPIVLNPCPDVKLKTTSSEAISAATSTAKELSRQIKQMEQNIKCIEDDIQNMTLSMKRKESMMKTPEMKDIPIHHAVSEIPAMGKTSVPTFVLPINPRESTPVNPITPKKKRVRILAADSKDCHDLSEVSTQSSVFANRSSAVFRDETLDFKSIPTPVFDFVSLSPSIQENAILESPELDSHISDIKSQHPQLSEEEIQEDMLVWQKLHDKYTKVRTKYKEKMGKVVQQRKYKSQLNDGQPMSSSGSPGQVSPDNRHVLTSPVPSKSSSSSPQSVNTSCTGMSADTTTLLVSALDRLTTVTEALAERDLKKDEEKDRMKTKLPTLEPTIYQGDELGFHIWMNSFVTLIENNINDPLRRLFYLGKYTSGPAQSAIRELLDLNEDVTAYDRAMVKLKERFGSPIIIANSFRKKIKSWPNIAEGDAKALQKYADFLSHCNVAMKSVGFLKILAEPEENKKLAEKFPYDIACDWNRKVIERMYPEDTSEEPSYPSFQDFCTFLLKESRVASGPCAPRADKNSTKKKLALLTDVESTTPSESSSTSSTKKKNKNKAKTKIKNNDKETGSGKSEEGEPKVKRTPSCLYCQDKHWINKCSGFLALTPVERRKYCTSNVICYGCLQKGHDYSTCKFQCNYLLTVVPEGLIKRPPVSTSSDKPQEVESVSHAVNSCNTGTNHYSSVVLVNLAHENKPNHHISVYALIDSQSDGCFLTDYAAKELGVDGYPVNLFLRSLTNEQSIKSSAIEGLQVTGYGSTYKEPISLPVSYTRKDIPANRDSFARMEVVKGWQHLAPIVPYFHDYDESIPVGLLLGYNCPAACFPEKTIKLDSSIPWAVETKLGWTVCGPVSSSTLVPGHLTSTCLDTAVYAVPRSNSSLEAESIADMKKIFDQDFLGPDSERKLSYEDTLFLRIMENGFRFDNNGHVELPLPVREDARIPPGSRRNAYRRFMVLKRKFDKDESGKLLDAYCSFFKNMFADGHAEIAPPVEEGEYYVWYLPHQVVYHPRKPDKPRVVYDGSAEVDGVSLNDILMQGPDLVNSLIGVLLRFREGRIGVLCDLMKMFHQVMVTPKWRNLLRFFWFRNNDPSQPIIEYRVTVHLFGASSSPSVATFALRKIAEVYEKDFGCDIVSFIRKYFYVDDGLRSVNEVDRALRILFGSSEMCGLGGFKLHQIASNNEEVLSMLPKSMLCKELQSWSPGSLLPVLPILGAYWCMQTDNLVYIIKKVTYELTRRGLLSAASSIYDPLGLISPVMLKGRLILQDLCHEKISWDQLIDDSVKGRWNEWYTGIRALESLRIPRCYLKHIFDVECSELHVFGDASGDGYGACGYLVLEDEKKNRDISLVMGKSRVKPLKKTTTPRLELQAAVLATKMSNFLQEELPEYPNFRIYLWTDSTIIIAYITNTGTKYRIYVANRVQTIRDITSGDQWGHVKSEDNPADIASRGCLAEEIVGNRLWFEGPLFLQNKVEPDTSTYSIPDDDPEVIKENVTLKTEIRDTSSEYSVLDQLNNLSSWRKMVNIVTVWRTYFRKVHHKAKNNVKRMHKMITILPDRSPVEERHQAKAKIVRLVQLEAFPVEMSKIQVGYPEDQSECKERKSNISSQSRNLRKLDIFLSEEDNVLKVGGRLRRSDLPLNQVHPMVLPRKHDITNKIIMYHHEVSAHAGRYTTVHLLRYAGWWVVNIRSAVDYVLKKCVNCRRVRGKPSIQKMADLPNDRLEALPPFTYACVDFFGPFYIKEKRSVLKRWACLFSCLMVRAVHIEMCKEMSTDSFILAYRRFVNRRGPVRSIRCDRGSNLMGAMGELDIACSKLNEERIRRHLIEEDCDWVSFQPNPPKASHMGGVWERMIGSVRRCLDSLLTHHAELLDDEGLRTLFTEAEGILNDRPLTYVELSSPDEPISISPSMLLTMKIKKVLPPLNAQDLNKEDSFARKRWIRVQYLAGIFWDKWKKDYLQTLTERSKWQKVHPNLQVDDIVLIVDDQQARSSWPLARIVSTKESADGLVRTVMVRTKNGIYCRPIRKIVLLYRPTELGNDP